MVFPSQNIVLVSLVGWRKPGKSAQTVSKKADGGFLRVDKLEEPFPGRAEREPEEQRLRSGGQSLSECLIRWLYLLAWWVQAGKRTLSRERGREIGGSFIKTIQLKSPRVCPLAHPAEAQSGQKRLPVASAAP